MFRANLLEFLLCVVLDLGLSSSTEDVWGWNESLLGLLTHLG